MNKVRRWWSAGVLAAEVAVVSASGAWAHHSYAAFDRARKMEISGVVKTWEWTNPHVWLTVSVPHKPGQPDSWSFEGLAPASLRAKGWSRTSLKPGDKVTVSANPRRDGTPGGALVNVTLASGQTLGSENPAAGQ